jgi:hypothetical protein
VPEPEEEHEPEGQEPDLVPVSSTRLPAPTTRHTRLPTASIADGSVRRILEPGIRGNRFDDGSYEWWGFSTNLTVASAFANSRLRSKLSTLKVANSETCPHIM